MILTWCALALAAPVRLERVDLVSEDSPTWLVDELPRVGVTGRFVGVRFAEQVGVVWGTPVDGLTVSTSLRAQGVHLERPVWEAAGLFAGGGVITRLGLPAGGRIGLSVRQGPVRIGASAALVSTASWARPRHEAWRVMPALGVGIGRAYDPLPSAVWMD